MAHEEKNYEDFENIEQESTDEPENKNKHETKMVPIKKQKALDTTEIQKAINNINNQLLLSNKIHGLVLNVNRMPLDHKYVKDFGTEIQEIDENILKIVETIGKTLNGKVLDDFINSADSLLSATD